MIYTRVGKYIINKVNNRNVRNISNWIPASGDVFYHQRYDYLNHGITIKDSIDEIHWNHMSMNPTTKFIHENCIETFDSRTADEISDIIKKYKINPSQFYFLLSDENHCNFLKSELENLSVIGCNFDHYNALLDRVKFPKLDIEPTHKFSALSRNYNQWRLNLFVELQRRSLLDNFVYSFHNIKPYNDVDNIIDKDTIRNDVLGEMSKNINRWIKRVPYNLDATDDVKNKYSDFSYYAILKSHINILVETHFQPTTDKNYCAHITEKTYKNIICKRPFIVFATPGWMKDFRMLGYKTFSPYIDESYDSVENQFDRLTRIVDEVQKLNNLSQKDFEKLAVSCKEITEYNYNLFLEKQKHSWSSEFKFLN